MVSRIKRAVYLALGYRRRFLVISERAGYRVALLLIVFWGKKGQSAKVVSGRLGSPRVASLSERVVRGSFQRWSLSC